jgi:hypothetical protein
MKRVVFGIEAIAQTRRLRLNQNLIGQQFLGRVSSGTQADQMRFDKDRAGVLIPGTVSDFISHAAAILYR